VVNPDDVVQEYGADSFRLYEMFMGPLDKSKPWSTSGLQGCYRFIQKVWKLFTGDSLKIDDNCADEETIKLLHQTIKKVTDDLSGLRFKTSVSQLMIFVNHLIKLEKLDKSVLHQFLLILNPFAPHLSEELNEMLGFDVITSATWPEFDESKTVEDKIEIAVQFNGKTRGIIKVMNSNQKEDVFNLVNESTFGKKYLYNVKVRNIVYIPNRIINIITS